MFVNFLLICLVFQGPQGPVGPPGAPGERGEQVSLNSTLFVIGLQNFHETSDFASCKVVL